jgi:CheY-like chemotaxis protein
VSPDDPALVLVVDDDDDIHVLFEAALRRSAYRGRVSVRTARDGHEALAALEAAAPALVIADVHMPRMDGPALLRALRAAGHGLPVVFMGALPEMAPAGVPCVDKADLFDDFENVLGRFLPR